MKQENDEVANESSNNQQQKETLKCIVQRQEKAEQVKYNDKSVEVKELNGQTVKKMKEEIVMVIINSRILNVKNTWSNWKDY